MTKEVALLQKIQGLFFFGGGLAGVFQNIFFFSLGNIRTAVLYDLLSLLMLFGLYLFSGKLLRSYSTRTLIRAGLAIFVVLNGLFFFLKEQSLHFIAPLGLLSGIGHGLFWSGNNLSQYILTHTTTRNLYFGRLNFWLNIALAAGPIMGGAIIWVFKIISEPIYGYMALFLIVAVIDFYLFFAAFELPRHSKIEFSFKHFVSHHRTQKWKIVLVQQFTNGLWDVAFGVITGILIFLIVQQEFTLGVVRTAAALMFAGASLIGSKILDLKPNTVVIAAIISATGIFTFGIGQNWWGIVALLILTDLFQPFLNISISKALYDVIDDSSEPWQRKYHYLVERDSVLGLGRIINYLILLLLFTPENQVMIAKYWILIIPIFPIIIGGLMWYQNKLNYLKQ